MKHHASYLAGACAALCLISSSQAANLRFVGMDVNTVAAAPSLAPAFTNTRHHVTPTFADLVSLPLGAGTPFAPSTGSVTATRGSSTATTGWAIDAANDSLTLSLNHVISGAPAGDNFAGSEGVIYFFALTPGTLTVTWDYGFEEPLVNPSQPYKVSERGRSAVRVKKNAKGLGEDTNSGSIIVNRDGSFTFNESISSADDLIALQFDLRILDEPSPSSIQDGFLTMTFTPSQEEVFPTNYYPPRNSAFQANGEVAFPGGIVLRNVRLERPDRPVIPPALGAPPVSIDTTFQFSAEVSLDGGATFQPSNVIDARHNLLLGALSVKDYIGNDDWIGPPLSIENGGTGGNSFELLLRESPTLQSTVQATIEARPDGNYQIDSFFDIWTELSVDGGATWQPASGPLHATMERLPQQHLFPTNLVPPLGNYVPAPGSDDLTFPGTNVVIRNFTRERITPGVVPPALGQAPVQSTAQDALGGQISTDGGITFSEFGPLPLAFHDAVAGEKRYGCIDLLDSDNDSIIFITPGISLRESPTLISAGEACIAPQSDGNYKIDSFFDIFTEISLDNGTTWVPASGPVRLELEPKVKEITAPTDFFPPTGTEFTSSGGDRPSESISFNFGKIEMSYVSSRPQLEGMPVGASADIDITMSVEGVLPSGTPVTAPGTATLRVTRNTTGTFDTEMLALNLTGGTLPAGTQLRESPTRASIGRTTLAQQPDGYYQIGSFFDIFTELSTDGGTTWTPGDVPQRLVLNRPAPAEFYRSNFLPLDGTLSPADPEATIAFAGGGLPTGQRMHKPYVFTKELDKSITVPPLGGTVEVDYTDAGFALGLSSGTDAPIEYTGEVTGRARVTNTSSSGTWPQTFDTEMLQLNVTGGTLPAGTMLRESPTRASTGKTEVRHVDGGFRIDSFFDVFVELSVDGGTTWSPAAEPLRLEQHSAPEPVIATDNLIPPVGELRMASGGKTPTFPTEPGTAQPYYDTYRQVLNRIGAIRAAPPAPGTTTTQTGTMDVELTLVGAAGPVHVSTPASFEMRTTGVTTGTFDTEMTALSISGGGLPVGMMLRESPTRASTGQTTITDIGGGKYEVSSFFDIFTELSVDGGATWSPADAPLHVELAPAPVGVPSLTDTLPKVLASSSTQGGVEYAGGTTECRYLTYVNVEPLSALTFNGFALVPPSGTVTGGFTGNGSLKRTPPAGGTISGVGPVTGQISFTHTHDIGTTRYFDTEMLALNLSGGTLPAGVMLRESPTLQSVGKTTLTTLPDGTYQISSFFDVFTELSVDGGTTWAPSDGPIRLDATNPSNLLVVGTGGGTPDKARTSLGLGSLALEDYIADDLWSGSPLRTGGVTVATGDVNGDRFADTIAGTATGASEVSVLSGRDGARLHSFFAFPGFTGGVNVAAGDINGDGFSEIIIGSGAGGGPHVKVFDGHTGAQLQSFFAFDAGFAGGVRVASGDVNGDGKADIITGAGPGASGGHVKVFDGATGVELQSFFAYSGFGGGVSVAAGDLDGDGRSEIITGADSGSAGGHVKVFNGETGTELRSFFAFDPGFSGGVRLGAGDLDGDGLAEIIAGAGPGGAPHVKVFDGRSSAERSSFLAFDAGNTGGVFVGGTSPRGSGNVFPDTISPVFTLPDNIVVDATSPSGAVVNYTASAADPGSGVASASFTPASGSLFPVGVTTVIAAATDGAGNMGNASFTVTVNPLSSLEAWRFTHFGTTEDAGNAADIAMPDGDGIANLIKYALVLPPGTSGVAGLPQGEVRTYAEGKRLSLTFTRDPARDDVQIDVWVTGSLTGPWTSVATSQNGFAFAGEGFVSETDAGDGTKVVEVRDTVNIGGANKARFMRIGAMRTPRP